MKKIFLLGAIPFLFGILTGPAQSYDDNYDVKLSKAAVYAGDYDSSGKVVSVTLLSYEGEDYLVAPNDISTQLIPLIEHTVNVTGTVVVDDQGRNVITISTFEEAFN